MKRRNFFLIAIILLLVLVGCEFGAGGKSKANSSKKAVKEKTTEEIQSIVHESFESIQVAMEELHKKNKDKWSADNAVWVTDPEKDEEGFKEAYDLAEESLTDLVTSDFMETLATEYLQAYFCECDSYYVFSDKDAMTRFEVVSQDKNSFTTSSLFLYDFYYEDPGTYTFDYIKEDGKWKFNGAEFISAKDKPLDLTFEDVAEYKDFETGKMKRSKLIDEIKVKGRKYLVISRDFWVDVIAVKDSTINYELGKKYNSLNKE